MNWCTTYKTVVVGVLILVLIHILTHRIESRNYPIQ